MGQHAYSDLPQQNTKHVQPTIAAQLNGATQPKNIGTFVIPEAKKPTKYGGWSVNPQLVDMRVGADIRKIRSESADVDAFGIENVRKLRQMGFTPDQINAYIKALSFNSENIQQTIGNDYKETISEKTVTKETETGYTADISPKAEKTEQIKEENQGVRNFSQWNTNHHIHIIQRSNKKEVITEVKPATPEEIANKKASGILRPFITAKRGEIIPKATYKDPIPVAVEPEADSTIKENRLEEASETIQDLPPIAQVSEETPLLNERAQSEVEAAISLEITEDTEKVTPLSANPFTKLTEAVPEEVTGERLSALDEEKTPELEVNKDTPSNAFLNRMHRTFEDEVDSGSKGIENPKTLEGHTPLETQPVNESEKSMARNIATQKLSGVASVWYGDDWSKYMMVKNGREDRTNTPPVQGLETMQRGSWQDKLSDKATELKKKIQ